MSQAPSSTLRIGALISGGGRTLMNIGDVIDAGGLSARIVRVITSREDVAGTHRARDRGYDVKVADHRAFADETALHDAITGWLVDADVDLVCACGYLRWIRVDEPFRDRIMNIHPALLPKFGGAGMYGMRVHRAVLAAGDEVSGCTIHFVDDEYDHGPVVLQRRCPVHNDDTPQALAARVFEQECIAYPEAIELFAGGRLSVVEGRVVTA